jgi:hypothetical protein
MATVFVVKGRGALWFLARFIIVLITFVDISSVVMIIMIFIIVVLVMTTTTTTSTMMIIIIVVIMMMVVNGDVRDIPVDAPKRLFLGHF